MDNIAAIKSKILYLKESKENLVVKKAISGDKACLSELIKENKISLYKIAYSYVKNQEDALEVLQECSYRAMLHIGKLKDPSFFKTWLTRIIINCSIDFLKTNKKHTSITEVITTTVSDTSISIDEKLDLYNAIDLLNEKYKTVVILKYFNDMTIENIASVMEIPANTVKTYLKRAKESMSKILKEDYLNE